MHSEARRPFARPSQEAPRPFASKALPDPAAAVWQTHTPKMSGESTWAMEYLHNMYILYI